MRILALLIAVACLAIAPMAAAQTAPAPPDLSGKWVGAFVMQRPDGTTRDDVITLNLKHANGTIAGTAGPNDDRQWAIEKAAFSAGKLTFQVQTEGPQLMFALTLAEGRLVGEANGDMGGQTIVVKVNVGRAR